MARGEDDQLAKVYRFEDDFPGWGRNQMTLAQCRGLIRSACELHGVPHPAVRQHNKRSYSWCLPWGGTDGRGLISLQAVGPDNKGAKNAAVSLHEAAHHIAYRKHGKRIECHGPTFVGIYLDLLVKANVAPRPALEAQLRHRGVKWRKF